MIDLTFAPLSAELHNGEGREPLLLIQGESAGRKLTMTLLNGGTPLDLTAAAAVALYCTKPDGTEEQLPCVVEDAANGTVSVTFTSSSCTVAGDMRQVIIRITWSDASNSRYVGPRIHVAPSPSDAAADSSNEFALLDQLIIQAQEVIGDAGEAASAANTAAGAANTAANAANTAAGAANTAATAANAAKDAANTAAGAANTAAGTANTAAGAANTAADRANQAAEDAEAVLEGAVTSVNGKTGAVTLAADDVGALPTSGGTVNGSISVNGTITQGGTALDDKYAPQYSKQNETAYFGIRMPDGSEDGFLRAPVSGFIPNTRDQSLGSGGLGTAAWPWKDIYARNINGQPAPIIMLPSSGYGDRTVTFDLSAGGTYLIVCAESGRAAMYITLSRDGTIYIMQVLQHNDFTTSTSGSVLTINSLYSNYAFAIGMK